jgi:hypothetical protein
MWLVIAVSPGDIDADILAVVVVEVRPVGMLALAEPRPGRAPRARAPLNAPDVSTF